MTGKVEDASAFGAASETAVLFLSPALAVNLSVYGWLGALAAGAWYASAFVVRPLG